MPQTTYDVDTLKVLAEIAQAESVGQKDFDAICDSYPALVEAVQAARPFAQPKGTTFPEYERLRNALAPFEFHGDPVA